MLAALKRSLVLVLAGLAITAFTSASSAYAAAGTGIASPADLVYSPDGSLAFVASPGLISVVDTAQDKVLETFTMAKDPVALTRTADGKYVYILTSPASCDSMNPSPLLILDTSTLTITQSVIHPDCRTTDITIAGDGRKIYLAASYALNAVDTASGQTTFEVYGEAEHTALSPDGTRLAVEWGTYNLSTSPTLTVYTISPWNEIDAFATGGGGDPAFVRDNTGVIASSNSGWYFTGNDVERKAEYFSTSVTTTAVTPDGEVVLEAEQDHIDAFALTSGKPIASFPIQALSGIWVSPTGESAYAGGTILQRFDLTYSRRPAATTDRLASTDRYSTAVTISESAHPSGADVVYVASGQNFPDALSAGPAAAKEAAPLLLTTSDGLPSDVATEITRLDPKRIVIIGGPAVMPDQLRAQIANAAPTAHIDWIYGPDRYATSRAIAAYAWTSAPTIYIADGRGYADAVGAASAAGAQQSPLLLIPGDTFSRNSPMWTAEQDVLRPLQTTTNYVVGGVAVVSLTAAQDAAAPHLGVERRLWGQDRYATSLYVNGNAFPSATHAYLAVGTNFPDALAGAALAGEQGVPLYTVPRDCVPSRTLTDLALEGVTSVTLLGGTSSLTDSVANLTPCG